MKKSPSEILQGSWLTRKQFLKGALAGLVTLGTITPLASLKAARALTTRSIPKSGETLPVIGLGTAYGFGASSGEAGFEQRKEVLKVLLSSGASVIDTSPSPSYGQAEIIIGRGLQDLGERNKAFIATKISTFGKGAGSRQMENSFKVLRTNKIDLLQVHNLKDTTAHLNTIQELKEQGRVRYIGVTHYLDSGLSGLVRVLNTEPVDFIQCHYSAFERAAEEHVLGLARDKGVAVIANRPFAGGSVFRVTRNKTIPAWAGEELEIQSWGQFFLKFTLSHPAVTVTVPGTDKPRHMADNLGAARGNLPNSRQRQKMIQFIENL